MGQTRGEDAMKVFQETREQIKKEEWNPGSMVMKMQQESHELTANLKSKIFGNITLPFT